jgi:hypothetical protein
MAAQRHLVEGVEKKEVALECLSQDGFSRFFLLKWALGLQRFCSEDAQATYLC